MPLPLSFKKGFGLSLFQGLFRSSPLPSPLTLQRIGMHPVLFMKPQNQEVRREWIWDRLPRLSWLLPGASLQRDMPEKPHQGDVQEASCPDSRANSSGSSGCGGSATLL